MNGKEACVLFPSLNAVRHCQEYIVTESIKAGSTSSSRLAQISITKDGDLITSDEVYHHTWSESVPLSFYLILFPCDLPVLARDFWREFGMGISSRLANYSLSLLSRKPTTSAHAGFDIAPEFLQSFWKAQDPCFGSAAGEAAKLAIRSRISDLLRHGQPATPTDTTPADIYLYPTGMCAIWNTHSATKRAGLLGKSVCFGYVLIRR